MRRRTTPIFCALAPWCKSTSKVSVRAFWIDHLAAVDVRSVDAVGRQVLGERDRLLGGTATERRAWPPRGSRPPLCAAPYRARCRSRGASGRVGRRWARSRGRSGCSPRTARTPKQAHAGDQVAIEELAMGRVTDEFCPRCFYLHRTRRRMPFRCRNASHRRSECIGGGDVHTRLTAARTLTG